jgi:D-alanyl-D-alanine carboxypeptidase
MITLGEKVVVLAILMSAVIVRGGLSMLASGDNQTAIVRGQAVQRNIPRVPPEPPTYALSAPVIPPPHEEEETPEERLAALHLGGSAEIAALLSEEKKPEALPAPAIPPPSQPLSPLEEGGMLVASGDMGPSVFRPRGVLTKLPTVSAKAVLLADLQTGEAYVDIQSSRRWPIASITKLMTAVIAQQSLNAGDVVALGEQDVPFGDTTIARPLKPGESYSVPDLIAAMLVVSSNEAGEALARQLGREEFLRRMNERAAAWELADTYFADPTGLSSANQSTPRDLAKLAARIVSDHPDVMETSRKLKITITDAATKKKKTLQSINQFAGEAWFIGGKTGFTDDAGGNLLTVFRSDRRPVVIVVLGTDDRFGVTEKVMDWFMANYRAVAR